jgi:YegS/Rv2252/BmrU family lipid kinase
VPAHSLAVIINPRSGLAGPDAARLRASRASAFLAANGGDPSQVFLTERAGHARVLAAAAVARDVATVVAWGGDGTMNEVASALAFTGTALALVPGGSGNGLARELRIPFRPEDALAVACGHREIVIDAGEIDGRYFFNVADTQRRRGLVRYARLTLRELWEARPEEVVLTMQGISTTRSVLLVAIANGRQYGGGAIIAPAARLDDGWLDVMVYEGRSLVRACFELPFLFMGRVMMLPGVTAQRAESIELTASRPIPYQLDGEAIGTAARLKIEIKPRALRVKTP